MGNARDQDEWFDVVDSHDRVIEQRRRHEVHRLGLQHRAVHIFVKRSDGKLLLQMRSQHKDTSPGKWTTSCSGHVDAGESYSQAALRELNEELGMSGYALSELSFLGQHAPCRETGQEFIHVYLLVSDTEPIPDPYEIDSVHWKTREEIDDMLRFQTDDFSPAFALVWGLAKPSL